MIGLGLVITTLILGVFSGKSVIASADDSTPPTLVEVNLFFQTPDGKSVPIEFVGTYTDISQIDKLSMNDVLKLCFPSNFVAGKSVYDEIGVIFKYADDPTKRDQGIAELSQLFDSTTTDGAGSAEFQKDLADTFDGVTSMITTNHLQNMTVDLVKTKQEAQNKAILTKLPGNNYWVQDFYLYLKPKPATSTVVDQTSFTADQQTTVTVGQSVDATTFHAKATNSSGDSIPVTVDTSKANLKKPGTYSVTLKAANGETKTVTLVVQTAPSPVVPKQTVVYGLKKLYLYQKPTFTKGQRVATYPKTKRTNRPMFKVIGYARSKSGLLRYQVKDAAGKTGYITAKSAFVAPVYYQKSVKRIKVLNKQGINRYQDLKLSKAEKHVRVGQTLKVVGLKHYHLTTRFELSNGQFVSANKKLVIAVK